MSRRERCTLDPGWIGSRRLIVESDTRDSIVVQESDDVKLLDYVEDGKWWSLWRKDVVGFIRR